MAPAAVVAVCVASWTARDAPFSWGVREVAQGTMPFPIWVPKLAALARRERNPRTATPTPAIAGGQEGRSKA